MLKILPATKILIYRKEEGIKVPSSGHFLDNVTILDSSGYFSLCFAKNREEEGQFKNIIFNLPAYRKEEGSKNH